MSSSPNFIVRQKNDGAEEELLVIDHGRSHTSLPRSRPNSRLEILIMDLVRSQTEMARSQEEMARSQEERLTQLISTEQKLVGLARSTEGKLDELARSHTAEVAIIMGRISSVEKSLHGTPSPSPIPGRRGSSPSAEIMNASVPPLPVTSFHCPNRK